MKNVPVDRSLSNMTTEVRHRQWEGDSKHFGRKRAKTMKFLKRQAAKSLRKTARRHIEEG